jgi:glycosyltransferase involved in cell wall biosynthesis
MAAARDGHAEGRRARELEAELQRTRAALAEADREKRRLAAELERLRRDEAELLDAVYRSRTWRAGRMVASVAAPALAAARSLGLRRIRAQRPVAPTQGYREAVGKGRPWHFARTRSRIAVGRGTTPLDRVARAFGSPGVALDAARAARITDEVERSGWANEDSLLAGRLSWRERRAVLEADAVARLALTSGHESAAVRARDRGSPADSVVVVDARCLQDAVYRSRGVGLHARTVVAAARAAAAGQPLVLLIGAELPNLDDEVGRMADDVVHTPYDVRDARVSLFLQLSPMTASAAPAVPFLAGGAGATASVVYDFIPTAFPSAYLPSATAALWTRVRIEALRHYDVLLPISSSTADACRVILGGDVQASVTGVADPLDAVTPASVDTKRPFVLIPAGGDPRKNVAAAVAAVARYRGTGRGALRAIVTGALTDAQAAALHTLAHRLALPADAVELRGSVSDADLHGLYRAAEFVLVPSFAEGFSIPVAEAVLRGTPVVASDLPVHRELVGAGPWLAPPDDIDALAEAASYVRRERDAVAARQRETLGDRASPAAVVDRLTQALASLVREPREEHRVAPVTRTRPRLALVSPFPPQGSGVADYTAFTFGQVARYADVEVYSGGPPDPGSSFAVHRLDSTPYLCGRFDAVVNVVGNSHFHFAILDLMESYGGACIAHDNRMIEAYRSDRGDAWTAELLSTPTRTVWPHELDEFSLDLEQAPSLGYELIAREAKPLIVHGRALAKRIERENGVSPVVVPFVPYNVPVGAITDAARVQARNALALADDLLHIASFGIVDRRTKGTDLVVVAAGLLRSRGVPTHVHIVGDGPADERKALELLAEELGIRGEMTLYGRVDRPLLEQFLLGVDVAVQLRTSGVLSLSGAFADCIAFGVPTVTTTDLADELEAPSYVSRVASPPSAALVCDAIDALRDRRRDDATIEAERCEYLSRRSVDTYARALLAALGLAIA